MSEFLITPDGVVLELMKERHDGRSVTSCSGCYFSGGYNVLCPAREGFAFFDNRCLGLSDYGIWVEVKDE